MVSIVDALLRATFCVAYRLHLLLASGCHRIVAGGGDGTLNGVASAIVQAACFEIHSHSPLHLNLDGEPVITKTMAFSTLPGALNLVR